MLRQGSIPPRSAHAVGVGIAGLILINSLLHLMLTGALAQTAFLLVMVGGAGLLFQSTAWLAVLVGLTLASWGAVVLVSPSISAGDPNAAIRLAVALPIATSLTALVHAARVRLLQLRRHTAELEARNEELDAFAHTVAHALKSPLQNLLGYAELLGREPGSIPEGIRQEALTNIFSITGSMDHIIEELLLLSEVRLSEAATTELDMGAIVAAVKRRLDRLIQENDVEIVVPDSWPVALGHAAWIEEVWFSYVSNALKYGGRPARVELGATLQADNAVRFWVRDNGQGLTPDEQACLFTPFKRLGQNGEDGHGLGLSIVQRITERLGGEVGVESVVGEGSTFYFTLPRA
jgi:signal transduction histidine kinase